MAWVGKDEPNEVARSLSAAGRGVTVAEEQSWQ